MRNRIKFLMFLFLRGTAFLIDLFFLNIFLWLNFEFIIARMAGLIGALIYNFSIDRNIIFRVKEIPIRKQIPKYLGIYLIANLTNLGVSLFFSLVFKEGIFYSNLASILGIISQIPITFFGLLLWVFKKDSEEERINS